MQRFYANGKLLITGEYLVLDGAVALAVPTRFGQSLEVKTGLEKGLFWKSYDEKGNCWFEYYFKNLHQTIAHHPVAERLQKILRQAKQQSPDFLPVLQHQVATWLTFPRDWGLGTSSTLIYSIGQWAGVNPFELLFEAFGGSGYDIACAGAKGSIFYQLESPESPVFYAANFNPPFADQLYFVYLTQKQDSKKGIQRYRQRPKPDKKILDTISGISQTLPTVQKLDDFENLLNQHEQIIAQQVGITPVKQQLFADYWGSVKSLGAWGGDFVLVTSNRSEQETRSYFKEKGFSVFLKYGEMVLFNDYAEIVR